MEEKIETQSATTEEVKTDKKKKSSKQSEIDTLKAEIEEVTSTIATKEKELKTILEEIKKIALVQFREGDTKVSMRSDKYEWVLSKSNTTEIDKESLANDGLLEKYTKTKTNYRLTTSEIKED